MGKIGRNVPCPCGSGVKYKHCCATKSCGETSTLASLGDLKWRQLRQLVDALSDDLMSFAKEEYYAPDITIALQAALIQFMGYRTEDEAYELADGEFSCAFLPWFMHNWTPDPHDEEPTVRVLPEESVGTAYLNSRNNKLSDGQREFLTESAEAHYSFYRVERANPGVSLELYDLLRKKNFYVKEKLGSEQMQAGYLICARLVHHQGQYIMDGSFHHALPPSYQYEILDFSNEILAGSKHFTEIMLCNFDVEIRLLYLVLRDELLNANIPSFQTADGDDIHFHTSRYELDAPVKDVLLALKPLTLTSEIDALFEKHITKRGDIKKPFELPWINRHPNKVTDMKEGHTVLGWFRFTKDGIVVETNSKKRGEEILRLIETQLGSKVKLKGSYLESFEQKLMANDNNLSPEPLRNSDIEPVPEFAEQHMKEIVKQYWDDWFETPIPALKHLTPNQAAKKPEMKEVLEALLADYEWRDERGANNLLKADIPYLKEKLGLS